MYERTVLGFAVALLLISGVTSQFMSNQAFAQNEKQAKTSKNVQVSESKFERKQAARQATPIASQEKDMTKFEHRQELRAKQQHEKQIANVKTSFQLKQEAKKTDAKNSQNEKDMTKFEIKEKVRNAKPVASQETKKSKFEVREEARNNQQHADKIANVKTSFQLKQEAKKQASQLR